MPIIRYEMWNLNKSMFKFWYVNAWVKLVQWSIYLNETGFSIMDITKRYLQGDKAQLMSIRLKDRISSIRIWTPIW